jgi:hypothetical protein
VLDGWIVANGAAAVIATREAGGRA